MSRVFWPHLYHFSLLVLKPSLSYNSPFEPHSLSLSLPKFRRRQQLHLPSPHKLRSYRHWMSSRLLQQEAMVILLPEAPNYWQKTRSPSSKIHFWPKSATWQWCWPHTAPQLPCTPATLLFISEHQSFSGVCFIQTSMSKLCLDQLGTRAALQEPLPQHKYLKASHLLHFFPSTHCHFSSLLHSW